MFEKIIEFSAHEDYFIRKEDYPSPIKLNIPEWYKKLPHSLTRRTVKGCMPFLDTLTTGYLLKIPQDVFIDHNTPNLQDNTKMDSYHRFALKEHGLKLNEEFINLNSETNVHEVHQIEGSPLLEKNKNLPVYKILNPWYIKTPKGYSCLFVPPLNNSDDRFNIIPGIVDTDSFDEEINFPFIINGDKYNNFKGLIKKGTPYVQVIPFKRDNWKMSLRAKTKKEIKPGKLFYGLSFLNVYKDKYWNKKIWK
jgi:hypothetical protein